MTSMTKHVESNAAMTAMVPFVGQYYHNMESLIGSFLGMDVVRLTEENSPVATNVALTTLAKPYKDEEAECRRQGFNERMITVFRENDLSLWRLPVFDLRICEKANGQILHKDLPTQDGITPGLFRYKGNGQNIGFILNIMKGPSEHIPSVMPKFTAFAICAPYVRRKGLPPVVWINEGQFTSSMAAAYRYLHNATDHVGTMMDECDKCLHFSRYTAETQTRFLKRYIEKTDPLFELAAPILQVDNPILPALEAPEEEEKPKVQPAQASNSWLSKAGAFVSSLWGKK